MTQKSDAQRRRNVLLVEDNEDDVMLTKYAFQKRSAPIDLHVTGEGAEALRFLRRVAPFEDAPTPDVILLDLNMPGMDGRQLLAELKRDDALKRIPAIVLSTSEADHDVHAAYGLHANAYLTKPLHLSDSPGRTQCVIDFWLGNVAILPALDHPKR